MKFVKTLLPVLAAAVTLAAAWFIPDSGKHPAADRPYFAIVILFVLAAAAILFFCVAGITGVWPAVCDKGTILCRGAGIFMYAEYSYR